MFPYKTITGFNEPQGRQDYIYTSTGTLTLPPGWTIANAIDVTNTSPNIGSIYGGLGNTYINSLYTSFINPNNNTQLSISQNTVPSTNNTYNLGSSTNQWANLDVVNANISGNLMLPTSGGTGGAAGSGTVYFTRIGNLVFWNMYNTGGGIACTTGSTSGVLTLSGTVWIQM